MKKFVLLSVMMLFAASFGHSQIDDTNIPVANDLTAQMPQPVYPEIAQYFCIKDEVRVLVEYTPAGGHPEVIKPLSGDHLLWDAAVAAAGKARFKKTGNTTSEQRGILTYKFTPARGIFCIYKNAVINDRIKTFPATYIKDLVRNDHLKIPKEIAIKVMIVVDESGDVVHASAMTKTDSVLLEKHSEILARLTKFWPTNLGTRINAISYLLFKFKPNGEVGL